MIKSALITLGCLFAFNFLCSQEYGDKNHTATKVYLPDGTTQLSNSVSYFDDMGRLLQSQSKDFHTDRIWANQTVYDKKGRPVVRSLSAPIGNSFGYKPSFMLGSSDGNPFNWTHFDDEAVNNIYSPSTVQSNASGTLGWYFSNNNTLDTRQDITSYPFSRIIYNKFTLRPNEQIGGNKINGEWPQAYSFTMQASDELSRNSAFDDNNYNTFRATKTVVRDVHDNENVLFTDTEGTVVANARSNGPIARSHTLTIGEQGYADIHVPQGNAMGFTVNSNGNSIITYNLLTGSAITPSNNLPNGFYRVAINSPLGYDPATPVTVTYKENYYQYALNKHDELNRVLFSYQPLGGGINVKPKTEYKYNARNELVYTKSPDEGQAWFMYRKDGQIRYSRSTKQRDATPKEVSYTEYDALGRPVESGVLEYADYFGLDPDAALPNAPRKEVTTTTYDYLESSELATLPIGYQNPTHLAGNVARTKNDETTSYYSYDIYGRVQWVVQEINGLGYKTIDYEYDALRGNTTKVIYQKGNASEQFVHRYSYNERNQLTTVETSLNNATFITQAVYSYNASGAVERTELAGIQGLDYTYTLTGRLKSINNPTLSPSTDPGSDTNDLFGMQIDYHADDFQRSLPHIAIQNYGTDQLNGNIKGIRWKNDDLEQAVYAYTYDRNNWLASADFGADGIDTSGGTPLVLADEVVNSGQQQNYVNGISVTVVPESHFKYGSDVLLKSTGTGSLTGGAYDVSNLTYDANGNIKSLKRNKDLDASGVGMDDLTYSYQSGTNQLLRVTDAEGASITGDDIGTQNNTNNYVYNVIGQLVENKQEGITYSYNTLGLVQEVYKSNGPSIKLFYNDLDFRIRKESYNEGGALVSTTHYVRDIKGNVMGIYIDTGGGATIKEHPIQGKGRVGIYKRTGTTSGTAYYELTDHLGNVRTVFSKAGSNPATQGYTDYFPFGSPMPNRIVQGDYRYAYQGQEKDSETGKEAFELRLWDSRIGRWLTTDPYSQYSSPYLGMGNDPINGIDPDGGLYGKVRSWFYKLVHGGHRFKNADDQWVVAKYLGGSYDFEGVTYLGGVELRNFGFEGLGKLTETGEYWNVEGEVNVGVINFAGETPLGFSANLQANTTLASFRFGQTNGEWDNDRYLFELNDDSRIGTYEDGDRLVFGGFDGVKERRGSIAYGFQSGVGVSYKQKFSSPEGQNKYTVGYSTTSEEVQIKVGNGGIKIHGLSRTGVNVDAFLSAGIGTSFFIGYDLGVEAGKTYRWRL